MLTGTNFTAAASILSKKKKKKKKHAWGLAMLLTNPYNIKRKKRK